MKSILAAAALAFGFALAVPGVNAAPLTAAPAASIDSKAGTVATEQVTFRRHYRHYRPYRPRHFRPYYGWNFGYARPWKDCYWRYGRRVCVWRY